jgi:hypothetical protein
VIDDAMKPGGGADRETGTASKGQPWRVGFAFLGGALAWTFHLLACWALSEWRCTALAAEPRLLGVAVTAWLLLGVSLVALAVAAAAAWVGRRASRLEELPAASRYLARAGFLGSGLFALVIAFQTVPILFFLGGC